MPGVLTIEAIAQCGAVAVLADEANRGKIPFFAGIDDCRFKRVVEPGDVLDLSCEFVRVRGPIAKGEGRASVGGETAAEATLTVFVGDAP
jgi:3-hydroxyacyl-[acyl-carrier-protein] dehydratase